MLLDLRQRTPFREVVLIWNVKKRGDLVRMEEVEGLLQDMPNLAVEPVLSRDPDCDGRKGRIDARLLREVLGENQEKQITTDFLICGPPAMISSCEAFLRDLGVSPARIHTERFTV